MVSYPIDGKCTPAYSRVLADTEILIALNLDAAPCADYIPVDACLSAVGAWPKKLLDSRDQLSDRYYFTAGHGSCSGLWDRIKREHSYYGRQRPFSRRAS